jgi:RHS repeat-associated protein
LKWDNSGEEYRYAPDNRRVFKLTATSERYYFFGGNGRVEVELTAEWDTDGGSTPEMILTAESTAHKRHLGYQRIGVNGTGVEDHLGGGAGLYPYGENTGRFATHDKDLSSGLHYADQRYYASMHGRFLTPDPYTASGGVGDPVSWNRYTYVQGDPVNFADPEGLQGCPVGSSTCIEVTAPVPDPLKDLLMSVFRNNQQRLSVHADERREPVLSAHAEIFQRTTFTMRSVLTNAMGHLSKNCVDRISSVNTGFGRPTLLQLTAQGIDRINFIIGFSGEGFGTSLADVSGLRVARVGTDSAGAYLFRQVEQAREAGAGTVYAATVGRGVILTWDYYDLSGAEQGAVLVHEAMHIAIGERNDVTLAERLGVVASGEFRSSEPSRSGGSIGCYSQMVGK